MKLCCTSCTGQWYWIFMLRSTFRKRMEHCARGTLLDIHALHVHRVVVLDNHTLIYINLQRRWKNRAGGTLLGIPMLCTA